MSPSEGFRREEEALDDLLAQLGIRKRSLELPEKIVRETDAEAEEHRAAIVSGTSRQARWWSFLQLRQRGVQTGVGVAALAALITALIVGTGTQHPAAAATPPMLGFEFLDDSKGQFDGQSATSALRHLASAARKQSPAPKRGGVQHVQLASWWLETNDSGTAKARSELVPTLSDHFFFPDGHVRLVEARGPALNTKGRTSSRAPSAAQTLTDESFEGPESGPSYAGGLSTDPGKLSDQLLSSAGDECDNQRAYCLSTALLNLNFTYVVPPQVAGAGWELLSELPDVSYLGSSRDRLDHERIAFVAPGSDQSRQVIILADPDTGALTGSEEVLVQDSSELGLKAPAVVSFTSVVRSAFVTESSAEHRSLNGPPPSPKK